MSYHRFSQTVNTMPTQNTYHRFHQSSLPMVQADTDYNKGGLGGGLKYVAGKAGTGAFGTLEGIWDFTAGGIASIFGNDDYAKRLMEDDIGAMSSKWTKLAQC